MEWKIKPEKKRKKWRTWERIDLETEGDGNKDEIWLIGQQKEKRGCDYEIKRETESDEEINGGEFVLCKYQTSL